MSPSEVTAALQSLLWPLASAILGFFIKRQFDNAKEQRSEDRAAIKEDIAALKTEIGALKGGMTMLAAKDTEMLTRSAELGARTANVEAQLQETKTLYRDLSNFLSRRGFKKRSSEEET